jgi:hypothetical protein
MRSRRRDYRTTPDGAYLPALSASAEELFATIGLESRDVYSGRHLPPLQDFSCSWIDSPQLALVAFRGAVPELAVDPGDAGDEAVGLDRAKNPPRLRIDLMDLAIPVLPHPERPFGPCQARVAAAAGRRDRSEHAARRRIDLLNAVLGELKQVPAVEGRSCMCGHVDRAQQLPGCRIEGLQCVSGSQPDVPAVICDAVHVVDPGERSVLTDDLGSTSRCLRHASTLADRQKRRE